MRTYSSEGFVIARRKFSEADRILILFTKDFGKIPVIAKGVRKLTSRKRGGIEIFTHIKFSAAKSHSLDILTEVEVLDSYDEIRINLKKVSLAYYFCEVIGRITRDEEKHVDLYQILFNAFERLKSSEKPKVLRLNFVKDALTTVGFWPHDKTMNNPDMILESIVERKINSSRVGRKMLQQG